MTWQRAEPQSWPKAPGVVVLEGQPGEARDAVVGRWLAERHDAGGPTWRLQCRPLDGGAWAGLATLIQDLLPSLRQCAQDLLRRHGRELCLVLPALRCELWFPQSLTDTAGDDEKTRNYAADRAYRCLHGLIELLSEWHEWTDLGPWSIACEHYDEANPLVRRFFAELVRRRGSQLALHMLVVVSPGRGDDVVSEFEPTAMTAQVRLALPRSGTAVASPDQSARIALELEAQLPTDPAAREADLPRLIDAWRHTDTPERALRWQILLMARYNHAGLYEAGLGYGAEVEAGLPRLYAENPRLYLEAVNVLYFSYVPLGRAEAARQTLEQALTVVASARTKIHYYYLLAMLYARFLQPADQATAEHYLQLSLDVLAEGNIPDGDRHFLAVFAMNGLAFVRLRQGRVVDALELCSAGVAELNEHLDPERHRLHRSVLLFNIAQVHAQIGPYEDAIDYFGQAMAMDPNYSEYYNDRGAVYFKMGLLEHAERDYIAAIELSPPYPEVWTNLGQCYRAMERLDEAVRAYTRALDLDPNSTLALVGRADAQFALDHAELAALADYDRALTIEPKQPLVLASRAIVHYECGRCSQAAADLDLAVELAPELAELYHNRAVALSELGRCDEAARDLRTYLELRPDAEDRGEVQESLSALARA
jgi:tetratricopeptide (TPR) repeat protein